MHTSSIVVLLAVWRLALIRPSYVLEYLCVINCVSITSTYYSIYIYAAKLAHACAGHVLRHVLRVFLHSLHPSRTSLLCGVRWAYTYIYICTPKASTHLKFVLSCVHRNKRSRTPSLYVLLATSGRVSAQTVNDFTACLRELLQFISVL
jgi:hypothetical protein